MFEPMAVGTADLLQGLLLVLALLGYAAGWYWIHRIVKDIEDD